MAQNGLLGQMMDKMFAGIEGCRRELTKKGLCVVLCRERSRAAGLRRVFDDQREELGAKRPGEPLFGLLTGGILYPTKEEVNSP